MTRTTVGTRTEVDIALVRTALTIGTNMIRDIRFPEAEKAFERLAELIDHYVQKGKP